MTPALVTELKRLEREATQGKWKADIWCGDSDAKWVAVGPIHEQPEDEDELSDESDAAVLAHKDAQFIVALRNSLPALLEAVETMHAALNWYSDIPGKVKFKRPTGSEMQLFDLGEKATEALARVAGLLGEGREKK